MLESVAFEYAGFLDVARRLFPDVAPGDVRVIGGGGDDALWNAIKAAVLDRPYVRLARESFSCWGAALVAAAAAGAVDDLAGLALSSTAEVDRALPDPELGPLYARRRHDYTAAVDLLVPAPPRPSHQEVQV